MVMDGPGGCKRPRPPSPHHEQVKYCRTEPESVSAFTPWNLNDSPTRPSRNPLTYTYYPVTLVRLWYFTQRESVQTPLLRPRPKYQRSLPPPSAWPLPRNLTFAIVDSTPEPRPRHRFRFSDDDTAFPWNTKSWRDWMTCFVVVGRCWWVHGWRGGASNKLILVAWHEINHPPKTNLFPFPIIIFWVTHNRAVSMLFSSTLQPQEDSQ